MPGLVWKGTYAIERQITEEVGKVAESPGFMRRMEIVKELARSLYVPDEQISHFLEGLKSLPRRFMYDMVVRCISPEFASRYGFSYDEIDPRQIMREVCDLEYGRVPEPQTPVQKEYIAMWAARTAKEMNAIAEHYHQLPPQAYQPTPAKTEQAQPQKPEPQAGASSLQRQMDDLFGAR